VEEILEGLEKVKEKQMRCPVCRSHDVSVFFRWKNAIVHQQFLVTTQQEAQQCKRGDIELRFCSNCGLIWNAVFDPQLLGYSAPYEATQMLSPTFQRYAENMAKYLIEKYDLRLNEILEIGCGDGSFLRLLCQLGHNRGIGFDPSWRSEGGKDMLETILIIPDYYSDRYANYQGDLVCCRHVLEHIHNPIEFLRELGRLTQARHPVFFFEVPNVSWSLRQLAVWDIYYEHCLCFSPSSLSYLFTLCGFNVLEVGEGFGGQYVWIESQFKSRKGESCFEFNIQKEVNELINEVKSFSIGYQRVIEHLTRTIKELTKRHLVVIWGAGAKAVTFLNLLDIQPNQIEFVVDINSKKWAAYVPGTGQKIVSPQFLWQYQPDVILVMNSEYLSEIGDMVKKLGITAKLWTVGTEMEEAHT
jgi:SAM-dependent methyltransferase